jgi:hypothetical protein
MQDFDDRRSAFETKFAFDQEAAFKAKAKAHRVFGRWAADLLGLQGAEAETYAGNVVIAGIASKEDAALDKVASDIEAAGKGGLAEARSNLAKAYDEIADMDPDAVKAV